MSEKRGVYLETTVVSYLAARPTRDLIRAARQEITREWWDTRKSEFDLFISQLVVDEAGKGDEAAAGVRLSLLAGMPLLDINEEATRLARTLLHAGALPARAVEDALHIALATVHGMDFLLTWNCSHIANAEMAEVIDSAIVAYDYSCPVICTPEELLGDWT